MEYFLTVSENSRKPWSGSWIKMFKRCLCCDFRVEESRNLLLLFRTLRTFSDRCDDRCRTYQHFQVSEDEHTLKQMSSLTDLLSAVCRYVCGTDTRQKLWREDLVVLSSNAMCLTHLLTATWNIAPAFFKTLYKSLCIMCGGQDLPVRAEFLEQEDQMVHQSVWRHTDWRWELYVTFHI